MKRLFPKKILKWKEPELVRKMRDEAEEQAMSPWFKPGVAVVSVVLLMLLWWLATLNPSKEPPSLPGAIATALSGGYVFAYVIPWIYRFAPTSVHVFEHGILRLCGNSGVTWKFREIDRCEIGTISAKDTVAVVLIIYTSTGKREILGVPQDLVPQLMRVLSEMNVKVEELRS